uniref:Uncharacterized protein n=1 Tax=Arundo donax TaxID=35708 RepID=A0A0A9FRC0_ARUDO
MDNLSITLVISMFSFPVLELALAISSVNE